MSGDKPGDRNRTVFQPSPLQGLSGGAASPRPPAGGGFGSLPPPSPPAYSPPLWRAPAAQDDIPQPQQPSAIRNRLVAEAAPILALAASIRAGRAREPLSQFHGQASAAVAAFDRTITGTVSDETRQRATYALCATIDDIAQNLPGIGTDGSEWARRSLVVQTFRENIGGDRFWQLADDMLARPNGQSDLIELFHACLAAGFEGRFRVMPDGKRRLAEIMAKLYGALEHPRSLSDRVLVPHWEGEKAPLRKVGFWAQILLAGAIAAGTLLLFYIVLRLLLMQSGGQAWAALDAINPGEPLRLSRAGGAPPAPPASGQAQRLETFLAPEIAQHLVMVDRDSSTVRVRSTVGQLFKSGSDALEPGREALFERIGAAVDREPGPVTVEGHADSDQPHGLTFPDNNALSSARANTVAKILASTMADASRITAQGFGDSRPMASNDTPDGKALNRRVEIVLQRHD